MLSLFETDNHRNLFVDDLSSGHMIQANQHVIVNNGEALILDPGGHKVYTKLFAMLSSQTKITGLKHIFFSHQDPDIIAAANGWLMVTDAQAHLSELWMRFIPHFGVDELVVERIQPIPDTGATLKLGTAELKIIPAHFLHSAGNFHLYDPVAKILYTGDLGASVDAPGSLVEDFDAHIPRMEGFHKRYMTSSRALQVWANTIHELDIDIIAPQHGAIFPNREMSRRFIDWISDLSCGVDLLPERYDIPV